MKTFRKIIVSTLETFRQKECFFDDFLKLWNLLQNPLIFHFFFKHRLGCQDTNMNSNLEKLTQKQINLLQAEEGTSTKQSILYAKDNVSIFGKRGEHSILMCSNL